jgi:hypothetical protein
MSAFAVPLSALRQLLAERFPAAARPVADVWPTGVPAVDAAAGGLPRRSLTELVCSAPSSGGELFIAQLLALSRRQLARVALIDATDNFDPQSIPPGELEHLVWVRCRSVTEAMGAADLCAREASLDLVILDLTWHGCSTRDSGAQDHSSVPQPPHAPATRQHHGSQTRATPDRDSTISALRKIPDRTWYRLQRAVEQTNLVFLVLTPLRLVASAQLRLQLAESHVLPRQSLPRPQLVSDFAVTLQRQRQAARLA